MRPVAPTDPNDPLPKITDYSQALSDADAPDEVMDVADELRERFGHASVLLLAFLDIDRVDEKQLAELLRKHATSKKDVMPVCEVHCEDDRCFAVVAPVDNLNRLAKALKLGKYVAFNNVDYFLTVHAFPAKFPRLPLPAPEEEEIGELLDDLTFGDGEKVSAAAERLCELAPTRKQAEIAKALKEAWDEKSDEIDPEPVLMAMMAWAPENRGAAIRRAMRSLSGVTRAAAYRAIRESGDSKLVDLLVARLVDKDERPHACMALECLGEPAEAAILKKFNLRQLAEQGFEYHDLIKGVLQVLRTVGGKNSLTMLRALRKDFFLQQEANETIDAIENYGGSGPSKSS